MIFTPFRPSKSNKNSDGPALLQEPGSYSWSVLPPEEEYDKQSCTGNTFSSLGDGDSLQG